MLALLALLLILILQGEVAFDALLVLKLNLKGEPAAFGSLFVLALFVLLLKLNFKGVFELAPSVLIASFMPALKALFLPALLVKLLKLNLYEGPELDPAFDALLAPAFESEFVPAFLLI